MSIINVSVSHSATLQVALETMDKNGLGAIFIVDDAERICGAATVDQLRDAVNSGATADEALIKSLGRIGFHQVDPNSAVLQLAAATGIIGRPGADGRLDSLGSPNPASRIPVAEPSLGGNELKYVTECVTTSWISSQGAFVRRFENEIASRLGAPFVVATSNGTTALHLALLAFEIGPGHEVIVPDFTFAATINAVLHAGAIPVIVDVDPLSWNIDPDAVAAAITPQTRAIIPVHLYGQPADMARIMAIATRCGLIVIEDAAEAMGSSFQGRPCGAIGHAGTFSFFSNKLITTGEGGAVVFGDETPAVRARRLRDHGMDPDRRYWHLQVGYNYRLTNLQAAVGCAQLEQADRFLARKIQMAQRYRDGLKAIDGLILPSELDGCGNSFWAFSIIPDMAALGLSREEFMGRLGCAGIETRPLFYPLDAMPLYRPYIGRRSFPNTHRLSWNGLSVPSSVTLADAQIDYICGVIRRLHAVRCLRQRLRREA